MISNTRILPEIDLERTPSSRAYRDGTKEAIQQVLTEVESQSAKRINEGFSEINFTAGVMNCFIITYLFAAFPEHLWIVYVVQALFFFPLKAKFLYQAKPLNQICYLLDYCWIMNMTGVIALIVIFVGKEALNQDLRRHIFLAAYGTACGPLFASTAVLPFISLIFHHLHSMTSVFIHFYPPLLFYILRWNSKQVLDAWPDIFYLEHDFDFWPTDSFTGTVFGNTIIAYLCWFVPYCAWIYFIGLDLPRNTRKKKLANGDPAPAKYDTVFHANHRNGNCVMLGNMFWKRSLEDSKEQMMQNDFEIRDLVLYLGLHLMAAVSSLVFLAYPCYLSKYAHGAFLVIVLIICTNRGSKRYTYYSTAMYARIIRTKFDHHLKAEENVGGEQTIIHEGM